MILHGVTPSPFTRKVTVVLEEKQIPFVRQDLSPFPKTAELMQLSPTGLIPILEDDGKMIRDSSVICAYLERRFPAIPLVPRDDYEYAEALFLEEYADTTVMSCIAPVFRERFVKPKAFGQAGDDTIVARALSEAIPPVFGYLEQRLNDTEFLLPRLSVADAALGSVLTCLLFSGEQIDSTRWPRLADYHQRLLQRASFKASMN